MVVIPLKGFSEFARILIALFS